MSPQELAALRYGGMQILSSDPPTYNLNSSFSVDNLDTSPIPNMSRPDREPPSSLHSDPASSSSCDEAEKPRDAPPRVQRWDDAEHTEKAQAVTPPRKECSRDEARQSQDLSTSFSSSVSYSSRQWNPSNSYATPSTLGRRGDDSFKYVVSQLCFVSRPTNISVGSSPSPQQLAPPPHLPTQSSQNRAHNHLNSACHSRWKEKPKLFLQYPHPLTQLQGRHHPRMGNHSLQCAA